MPHKAKGEALGFDQEAETGAKGGKQSGAE